MIVELQYRTNFLLNLFNVKNRTFENVSITSVITNMITVTNL